MMMDMMAIILINQLKLENDLEFCDKQHNLLDEISWKFPLNSKVSPSSGLELYTKLSINFL
jgi:hypothetical protein